MAFFLSKCLLNYFEEIHVKIEGIANIVSQIQGVSHFLTKFQTFSLSWTQTCKIQGFQDFQVVVGTMSTLKYAIVTLQPEHQGVFILSDCVIPTPALL